MKKLVLSYFILCFFATSNAFADLTGVNAATQQLCLIIEFFNGRIMRGIIMFALFGVLMAFVMGSVSWQKLMVLAVGIGLVGNAGSIALLILPTTVMGVSGTLGDGTVFNPTKKYTPEQIISKVCPNVVNAGGTPSSQYMGK